MNKDNDMSAMLLKYFLKFFFWKHYHKSSRAAKWGYIRGAVVMRALVQWWADVIPRVG